MTVCFRLLRRNFDCLVVNELDDDDDDDVSRFGVSPAVLLQSQLALPEVILPVLH
jgi:hypothetical protein